MEVCPICYDKKNKSSLCKASFTYQSEFDLSECSECRAIYLNPLPSANQFIDFYSTGGYEFDRWKQESKAKKYIKELNKKNKSGRFLDVGCATGYMINRISQEPGWEVYGVELSKKPVYFAREVLGLENITHGDLFSAEYPESFFDCINVSDVLEHVPNPVEFLVECRRILKPDGILFLGVPNGYNDSRGLIRYYESEKEAGCHASGHIFFFQKETFQYLFEHTGFEILEVKTVGIKNGLRNIGLLPRKANWKDFYRPRKEKEVADESEIKPVTRKKYPDFYYDYRYLKNVWFAVPGIHNFGLNLNFLLTLSVKDEADIRDN